MKLYIFISALPLIIYLLIPYKNVPYKNIDYLDLTILQRNERRMYLDKKKETAFFLFIIWFTLLMSISLLLKHTI